MREGDPTVEQGEVVLRCDRKDTIAVSKGLGRPAEIDQRTSTISERLGIAGRQLEHLGKISQRITRLPKLEPTHASIEPDSRVVGAPFTRLVEIRQRLLPLAE